MERVSVSSSESGISAPQIENIEMREDYTAARRGEQFAAVEGFVICLIDFRALVGNKKRPRQSGA